MGASHLVNSSIVAIIGQDVETVDPVLNPLLNRELQRTGGRTLIRLGSEDIDYSPDFLLLLVTRNPGARFAPDLCSRVTIVNFTVTPASLQSQVCLIASTTPCTFNFCTFAQCTFVPCTFAFVVCLGTASLCYDRYLLTCIFAPCAFVPCKFCTVIHCIVYPCLVYRCTMGVMSV